jgi:hypothetical protein
MHRDVTSGIAAAEIDAGLFKVPQFSRRLFDELLEAAVQLRRPNPDFLKLYTCLLLPAVFAWTNADSYRLARGRRRCS